MGSPAGDDDAADRGSADQAGLTGSHIDLVLDLKKAPHSIRIHVIGDGRAPGADGGLEDSAQGGVQAVELIAREAAGAARGADAGPEKALVGIDIAHPVQ